MIGWALLIMFGAGILACVLYSYAVGDEYDSHLRRKGPWQN
jgi:hypothetical protein